MMKQTLDIANEALSYRGQTIDTIRSITSKMNSLVEVFKNGRVDFIPRSQSEWVIADGWKTKFVNIIGSVFDIYSTQGAFGTTLPMHSHIQQETIIVISGKIKVVYKTGEQFIVNCSESHVIAPEVCHSVEALEDCELTILFHPPITKL